MTSTWAAVSIGDGTNTRQLTGLAAGTNDTDAVNVAQLKSMNLAFTADGSTKGDVNLTNSALNVVGDSTYITTKGDNQNAHPFLAKSKILPFRMVRLVLAQAWRTPIM